MSNTTIVSKTGERHIKLEGDASVAGGINPHLYDSSWKDLIFLPFNSTWRFFVNLSIIWNAAVIVYNVGYDTKDSDFYLYLTFEAFYAIDVGLCIAHR